MNVENFKWIGECWLSRFRFASKSDAVLQGIKEFCNAVNAEFERQGIGCLKISRGYQFNDLVVRHRGRHFKYTEMVPVFRRNVNLTNWAFEFANGKKDADDFNGYHFTQNEKDIAQSFVAIVYIAEYSRYYKDAVDDLKIYFKRVIDDPVERDWHNFYTVFPPALTSKEDDKTDYQPME